MDIENKEITTEIKERKRKTWEELTFKDYYLFKRVMCEIDICTRVLETLLNIKIIKVEYIQKEVIFKENYDNKGIRLDVYLEDSNGVIYDIEMQVQALKEEEFAKRLRYYQALIDASILYVGQDYEQLKKLYIIFICPFKLFDGEQQIYTFKNYCKENKEIELKDDVTKILVSTKGKKDKSVNADLEALFAYINGDKVDNPLVNMIDDRVKYIKNQEEERTMYKERSIEAPSTKEKTYMQYGLKIRDERKEAKEEGRAEGRIEERIKNLKSLMENANFSIETAMKMLSIPQEKYGFYISQIN